MKVVSVDLYQIFAFVRENYPHAEVEVFESEDVGGNPTVDCQTWTADGEVIITWAYLGSTRVSEQVDSQMREQGLLPAV